MAEMLVDAEETLFVGSPDIWRYSIHPDISIVAAGTQLGNVDPRFSERPEVDYRRSRLALELGCTALAIMIPKATDRVLGVDANGLVWGDSQQLPERLIRTTEVVTDGFITNTRGVGVMLNAADCASLVLYDPKERVLALPHVGRKGAALGIAPKTLRLMTEHYGTRPEDVITHFGPSIAPESYVMQELRDDLLRPEWQAFAFPIEDGYKLDVVGFARKQIVDAGVLPENISAAPVDVASDERFFSFTRHKQLDVPNGRNGFAVMINPEN